MTTQAQQKRSNPPQKSKNNKQSRKAPSQTNVTSAKSFQSTDNMGFLVQRAQDDPNSLSAQDVLQLQRSIGNRTTAQLLGREGQSTTQDFQKPNVIQRAPLHIDSPHQKLAGDHIQRTDKDTGLEPNRYVDGQSNSGKGKSPETTTAVPQTKIQRTSKSNVVQRTWWKKDNSSNTTTPTPPRAPRPIDRRLAESMAFEHNLGIYLYKRPEAKQAAQAMLSKMTAVMVDHIQDEEKKNLALLDLYYGKSNDMEKLRRERLASAGQVGRDINAIKDMMGDGGNLREKMTMLYNAMFGPFKQYINKAMKTKWKGFSIKRLWASGDWDEMASRGLNVTKLKRRKKQKRFNKRDLYRNPYLATDRKRAFKNWNRKLAGVYGRMRRAKSTDGERQTTRTVSDLETAGIGLSNREKMFQFGNTNVGGNTRLKWQEGGTYFNMINNHKWVREVKNSLRMPVISGPSGTAQRMFQLWEFLNKPADANSWRLAILGWMMTGNDHSFHELMTGMMDYLPYRPGQRAYHDIPPVTEDELRENACHNSDYPRLFPDEIDYHRKLRDRHFMLFKPYQDQMDEASAHSPLLQQQTGLNSTAYDQSAQKHMFKLATAYTLSPYQAMNIVSSRSKFTATRIFKRQIAAARSKTQMLEYYRTIVIPGWQKSELTEEEAKKWSNVQNELMELPKGIQNMVRVVAYSPDVTAEKLYAEIKQHNVHMSTALGMLPTYSGTVYRGEPEYRTYTEGDTVPIKRFLSSSRKQEVATQFVGDAVNNDKTKTPRFLEIVSRNGRDVNAVSGNEKRSVKDLLDNPETDEVIFLPGTKFKVKEATLLTPRTFSERLGLEYDESEEDEEDSFKGHILYVRLVEEGAVDTQLNSDNLEESFLNDISGVTMGTQVTPSPNPNITTPHVTKQKSISLGDGMDDELLGIGTGIGFFSSDNSGMQNTGMGTPPETKRKLSFGGMEDELFFSGLNSGIVSNPTSIFSPPNLNNQNSGGTTPKSTRKLSFSGMEESILENLNPGIKIDPVNIFSSPNPIMQNNSGTTPKSTRKLSFSMSDGFLANLNPGIGLAPMETPMPITSNLDTQQLTVDDNNTFDMDDDETSQTEIDESFLMELNGDLGIAPQ